MNRPLAALVLALSLAACAGPSTRTPKGFYRVEVHAPLTFIAYGDMRFTAPSETQASIAPARRALVARIAAEAPAALFLNGDVPWHGGTVADYDVFRQETSAWREARIPVYPALGNHEFYQCAEAECLENWWAAFPSLRTRRWYAVAVGPRLTAIALDSDASLEDGSAQRAWLDETLARQPRSTDFVLVYLHHPPVADVQRSGDTSHNPRPNERALAARLEAAAAAGRVRFIVCAGHIHNYERREQGGVTYLVSGGGGARPYEVVREAEDRYSGPSFPNFHYLRFTLEGDVLRGEMVRLEDYDAPAPVNFVVRDRFEVRAAPRG